jgi:uncharacterized membrane protein
LLTVRGTPQGAQNITERPTLIAISDNFVVQRPVGDVFAYVSNLENLPYWAKGVQAVTRSQEGPTEVGTVFNVTGSIAGRQLTVAYRITGYELNQKLSAAGKFAFLPFHETFRFRPSVEGTQVTQHIEMQPQGIANWATPLLRIVLGGQIRGDNRRLKQALEAQSGAAEG